MVGTFVSHARNLKWIPMSDSVLPEIVLCVPIIDPFSIGISVNSHFSRSKKKLKYDKLMEHTLYLLVSFQTLHSFLISR